MERLDSLTRSELEDLKALIDKRLSLLLKEEQRANLTKEIEENGYVFRKELIESDYPVISLRVGLSIRTWNKEDRDREDWHLSSSPSEQQDPWFDRLEYPYFDYLSIDDIESVDDDWTFGDWDDPIWTNGWTTVWLYFRRAELPPEGEVVDILMDDQAGKIHSLVVKDGTVYIDDEPVDNWNGDVFILPE